MIVDPRMKLKHFKKVVSFKHYQKYFLYSQGIKSFFINQITVGSFFQEGSVWNYDSMEKGLKRLDEITKETSYPFIKLRPKEKGYKKDVSMFYFPVKDSNKPYVIILAGGAFEYICNLIEGFPIAAICNELGFNAFVLNYSVDKIGMFPNPLEDISLAVKYIENNYIDLGIKNTDYILGGFSAGATIAGNFATKHIGAPIYDVKRPCGLFLGYPFVNIKYSLEEDKDTCFDILGKPYEECLDSDINIDEHIDDEFPKTYIVYAEDDERVDPKNSIELFNSLKDKNIKVKKEVFEKGGHGFGDGSEIGHKDWIQNALEYLYKESN